MQRRRSGSARQWRHRGRQRGLESRRHWFLVHALSARGRAARGGLEFLSAGLFSPAGHGYGARRIRRWESNSRASPKWSCDLPTTASTSWRAWPTAMAASSCTSCCCPTGNGTRSRASPIILPKRPSGRTERCIFCRARTLPWGKLLALAPPAFSRRQRENDVDADAFVHRWIRAGGFASVCALHGGRTVEAVRYGSRQARQERSTSRRFPRWGNWWRCSGNQLLFENESLRRALGVVSLRSGERAGQEDGPVPDVAGRFQRRRSDPPDRDLEGRHARADDHPAPQGHQARRQESDAAHRLRRLRHQPCGRAFRVRRRLWLDHGGVWVVANLRGGARVRRDLARTGPPHQQAECLRRLHRLRRVPDQGQVHQRRQAGHRRRQQRRLADGRGADAASRAVPRRVSATSASTTCCASRRFPTASST